MQENAAPGEPTLEHRFNGDLLIDAADRELAQSQFPEIYHVLDHPELQTEFRRYDALANRGKRWVHRVGLLAVGLATVALLFSAVTPLLKLIANVPTWVEPMTVSAEVCGLAGAAIASGGILIAGQKRKWLQARLMAEVFRLWHFQFLICRGQEIDASCGNSSSGGLDAFQAGRTKAFKAFAHEWSSATDSRLQDMVESPEAGYQLLHDAPSEYGVSSPVLEKVLAAYKLLRFRHQANYASYKLQKTTDKPWWPLAWPVAVLQRRVEAVTSFCLIGSLLISLLIVTGHLAEWQFTHHPGWAGAMIGLLIFNVATRAVQDGLAVPEELQRYNDYSGSIRYLITRFEGSSDFKEKLHLMQEMERAALQELKGFLRAYYDARFLV